MLGLYIVNYIMMDEVDFGVDAFDDDVEVVDIMEYGFPRQIQNRNDLFHSYDDLSFFRRFRLTKETVLPRS